MITFLFDSVFMWVAVIPVAVSYTHLDVYKRQVKDSHDRPLIEQNKNVGFIEEMMEQRRPKYEAAADIIIYTDQKSASEICEEIAAQVCAGQAK